MYALILIIFSIVSPEYVTTQTVDSIEINNYFQPNEKGELRLIFRQCVVYEHYYGQRRTYQWWLVKDDAEKNRAGLTPHYNRTTGYYEVTLPTQDGWRSSYVRVRTKNLHESWTLHDPELEHRIVDENNTFIQGTNMRLYGMAGKPKIKPLPELSLEIIVP